MRLFSSSTCRVLLFSLLFVAIGCRNDRNNDNPPNELLTEEVEKSERVPDRDNLQVDAAYVGDAGIFNPRNMRWYTYRYTNREPREEITAENPIVRSENLQEREGVLVTEEVYEISETSRPPLFNKNCLTAANPEQCSNEAVLDWMKYAVERPETPNITQEEPLHFVTFVINEAGKISAAKILALRDRPVCEACRKATLEAVAGMPDWMPAIRNGRAVKVQLTLPVYYD